MGNYQPVISIPSASSCIHLSLLGLCVKSVLEELNHSDTTGIDMMLYQGKESLHTPYHELRQYWLKYGSFQTRFDERV